MPEVPPMPSAKLVFAEPTYGIADILEHGSVGQFHPAKPVSEIVTVKKQMVEILSVAVYDYC